MDAIRNILDWLSLNSRNLSEVQKRDIHLVLESLRNQLETRTQISSSSRYHQAHQSSGNVASTRDRNENKFDGKNNKVVNERDASLETKIQQVTNIISNETGYINGKIDTISKQYNEQMKMLRKQVRDLQNEKNQKEVEKNKVSDRDIDHLTESLKSLMNSVVPEPCPYPPIFNSPHPPPYDCPPPYHLYPPTIPNQNISYFPTHASPRFLMAPRPPGPSSSFPSSHLGSNLPKPPNEKVYRFSGNSGSGPKGCIDSKATTDSDHHKNIFFKKAYTSGNRSVADMHSKKKYCEPNLKKTDFLHQKHGSKNEFSSRANRKFQHKTQKHNEQFAADSSNLRDTDELKNYADRGRNKRFQQFGKNRPLSHDDGRDSDASTISHASSKDIRNKLTVNKTGNPYDCEVVKNKNPQSTSTDKTSSFQNRPKNDGGNYVNSTASHEYPKNLRKEHDFKNETEHQRTSTAATNETPQSTKKNDSAELEKLQYPSIAEALKRGIDIYKRIDPPCTCLGKVKGVPFSKPAHCLEDIYNFEKEFGPCQVIRY